MRAQFSQYATGLACCLLLTACAAPGAKLVTVPRVALDADRQIERPVLCSGQQWHFRRTDLWRNSVRERFEQELSGKMGEHWLLNWRITQSDESERQGSVSSESLDDTTHAFLDGRYEGRHMPLNFPLQPGKRWTFSYGYHPAAGRATQVEQTAEVIGWEYISVPAGGFRALKVVHRGRYRATEGIYTWNGNIFETYWYAPEAGRVVKMEYRDTQANGVTWDWWRDELVAMKRQEPVGLDQVPTGS